MKAGERLMQVTLINPGLVVLRSDPFTTGIPYMPVSLAYAAAAMRALGHAVTVIDAFGEAPRQFRLEGRFLIRGLTPIQVEERMPHACDAAVLYASHLTSHHSLEEILRTIRRRRPDLPIIVMENTQAVTAYSLRRVMSPLLAQGATYLLCGEAEQRLGHLLDRIAARRSPEGLDGIGWRESAIERFTPPATQIAELDALPLPAWELFPLESYWSLRYAHGAFERDRYLPLLTSRGCPYPCKFCVIPETNNLRWRSRSPEHVVAEMTHWQRTLGVSEFHIEDVNPTINDERTRAICRTILAQGLQVIWKISAGTKVESLKSEETIDLMAAAGCRYISISPESGSPDVMRRIGKPFDLEHAIRLVGRMSQRGIQSQCCFVLGFPGETEADRQLTWQMVHRLVQHGADEIALFIVTPVPGSQIYEQFSGFDDFSQLNFSPTWRQDYVILNRFRLKLYRAFLWWKLRYAPHKLLRQPWYFVSRRFRTKMEMTPYRALHTILMSLGLAGVPAPSEPRRETLSSSPRSVAESETRQASQRGQGHVPSEVPS